MTDPTEYVTALLEWWYTNHAPFRAVLDGLFQLLGIAEDNLPGRLYLLGTVMLIFFTKTLVSAIVSAFFRRELQAGGGLTPAGRLVTPEGTPVNSPTRPGPGGGNGNGSDSGGA
jgi:hypothetical protein